MRRVKIIKAGFIVVVLLILLSLFNIQLLKHHYWEKRALQNLYRSMIIPPIRGFIKDREGRVLAGWKPSFHLLVTGSRLDESELKLIEEKIGKKVDLERYEKYRGTYPVLQGLNFEEMVKLEEISDLLPGFLVAPYPCRYYYYPNLFAHVIGYVGEVTKEEIKNGYAPGEYVGRMGIEKSLENILKGRRGYRFFTVSVRGNIVAMDPREPIPPEKGEDVTLTLDLELTQYVDSILKKWQKASVVVLNVKTGEILVLYSKPSFDPNRLSKGLKKREWEELLQDADAPLLNRAVSGLYPPGSIFKLITALIGLHTGVVTKTTHFAPCRGAMRYGNKIFRCWKSGGHGSLDLIHAIEQSCDIYFYQLGLKIGLTRFLEEANKLNLTMSLNVGLPEEKRGFIPTYDWYVSRYGKRGFGEGNVINLSIGQGEILLTPLEIATFTGIIARDTIPRPHLIKKIGEKTLNYKKLLYFSIPDDELEIVREGMLNVVEGRKGTGKLAKVKGIKVAGKTGTAQNPLGKDHSLFTCFAPYEDPDVVVTVVVENAGHGGSVAAPIAGMILKKYFGSE